jgi:colicin import membrane protein
MGIETPVSESIQERARTRAYYLWKDGSKLSDQDNYFEALRIELELAKSDEVVAEKKVQDVDTTPKVDVTKNADEEAAKEKVAAKKASDEAAKKAQEEAAKAAKEEAAKKAAEAAMAAKQAKEEAARKMLEEAAAQKAAKAAELKKTAEEAMKKKAQSEQKASTKPKAAEAIDKSK